MNKLLVLCVLAASLLTACGEKAFIEVDNLRCEELNNPVGIDSPNPRLSWDILSGSRDIRQKSYRILVSSSLEKLENDEGDLWDSGKDKSDNSIFVPYKGAKLDSRTTSYWKVCVTTNKGKSEWSKPALWTMGLTDPADWKAKWTGLDKSYPKDVLEHRTRLAARYFRKEFAVENKDIANARLYISGLGLYEAYINAARIGEQVLSPTPTDYTKVVKYNTFDITSQLTKGINTIGITLGNGRFFSMRGTSQFGFPKMILQLEIKYTDGSNQTIISDDSWKVTADGPIVANNEFDGEEYDARKEMPGWNKTGFDDSAWLPAELVDVPGKTYWTVKGNDMKQLRKNLLEHEAIKDFFTVDDVYYAGFSKYVTADILGKYLAEKNNAGVEIHRLKSYIGQLEAQINKNIKVMETIHPVSVSEIQPGTFIMDMGQNMVGWLRMKVKGKAGDEVQLRFAEVINDDGSLYVDNLRGAKALDKYILKGETSETWSPSFTYHGFRYVEIIGFPNKPTVNDFEGLVVYDEMEQTGKFETSNETINQIYKNAYWGIRGNYRGMPTDCPQRDERMGWLGDRAVGSQGESFMFGNNNLYAKWLDDIEESQRENGSIPDVAPNYWSVYSDNMTWPGAYVIIANMLYEQYGNKEPIEKHYESMKKWIDYMQKTYLKDNIMTKDTYGDWCMPPESPELIHSNDPARKTDGAVLSTTFYYRILNLLEKFAVLLDKEDEAEAFAQQAEIIKNAFNDKYFDKNTKQYSNNTVTANLLPLCYGMVADEYKEDVFKNIVDKTMGESKGHVSTGLVGIQWLMRGLSEYGRADIAYKIVTNRDYPSWGYMIENNATTIWELWNGNTADPGMNSGNHVMLLGDLLVWFYEYLAGIQNNPNNAGFEEIVMKPYPVEGLTYVKASYKSVRGLIKSEWTKAEGSFTWDISVPCNATATVYIPITTEKNKVTESGKKASSSKGVKFLHSTDKYRVFKIGSGNYSFKVN